jgi:thiosulfate/3-mercaptopyruvate sulfurtransferase
MWATRVWWLLRVFGFDNAAILNGGWTKWKLEGRRVSKIDAARPPVTFVARPQPDLIVNKEIVLSALDDRATCVVNSLSADNHEQQRIASSINVPARSLLDSATGAYLPADELRQIFDEQDILNRERVITYCGAGIAATSDAFVLTLLGVKNVSVYSASMQEWAADPTLPTEKG